MSQLVLMCLFITLAFFVSHGFLPPPPPVNSPTSEFSFSIDPSVAVQDSERSSCPGLVPKSEVSSQIPLGFNSSPCDAFFSTKALTVCEANVVPSPEAFVSIGDSSVPSHLPPSSSLSSQISVASCSDLPPCPPEQDWERLKD